MQDLVVLDLSGTPTWIAAKVVKETDNRFKIMSYLQKVIVKKKCQKEERRLLSQQFDSDTWQKKDE